MQITVNVKGSVAVNQAVRELGPKTRSALSYALNQTANDAQLQIRAGLRSRFTLRRDTFVQNTIYRQPGVDFATKSDLTAAVRVHPQRNFLAQHEDGGPKVARDGGNVAIPLKAVQPSPLVVVPKRLRPSGLKDNRQVHKITTPSGTFLIRRTRGSGGNRRSKTEFLYKLTRSVGLKPKLAFVQTATTTIDRTYQRQALLALDFAYANW